MMNDLKKYIAVLCAVLILVLAAGATPFAIRALAVQTVPAQAAQTNDGTGNVTPPDDTQKDPSGVSSGGSSQAGSKPPVSGTDSSGGNGSGGSGASSRGSSAESDLVTVTFNLNGGTGMKTSAQLEKGTSVSQLKTPTKSGYRFVGWSQGGVILSDSKILDRDTSLTANWKKEQSGTGSENTASVDTRQSEVDAAASAAREATSDPDVLSSEDWNSILSASSAQSAASSASSQPVSSASSASGGFSTLLAAGIALILLGVAGVVAFVYLQFIRKPPRGGGPRGGSGGGRSGDKDDTMTFTDVSSYSNGKKPDDASAVLYPQSSSGRTPPPSSGQPAPGQQPASDGRPHEARLQDSGGGAKTAARNPAGGQTSADFDWQKFFESEEGR